MNILLKVEDLDKILKRVRPIGTLRLVVISLPMSFHDFNNFNDIDCH